MINFRKDQRRHFRIGVSGYIGAGNKIEVFTRRPKSSFSKLRQLYGDQLERLKSSHSGPIEVSEISLELREKIKSDIRKQYKRTKRNQIFAFSISIVILVILIIVIAKVAEYYIQNFK